MVEHLNILVIDDNKDFCDNVKDVLEMKNFKVDTAYDGIKGLEMVKQRDFDMVLLDIKMPVMNGIETFRKIKEINPHINVIMVTAYAVEELIRDALRDGAYGSLKKPLDFEKLFSLINTAVTGGTLLLIADDDKDLCGNLNEILTEKGYVVAEVHDGESAFQKAKEHNFDILLLDMRLPPLNGLETYLSIRDIRPDIVVIIITGYMKEMGNLVEEALTKTAYSYIEKPIDMVRLISLLEEIKEKGRKAS